MEVKVLDQYVLTDFQPEDKDVLVSLLNEKAIYDQTLRLPNPYTEADAIKWLETVAESTRRTGRPVQFALRAKDKKVIGGCGFDGVNIEKPDRAEIGYWLGKAHWGKGIMAAAVKAACEYAFREFKLHKITAHVFERNVGSIRILEECGFQLEGTLSKHFLKGGEMLDGRLYGLTKPEEAGEDGAHLEGH